MRVVPEGESVIPVRSKGKPKRAESPAATNGEGAHGTDGTVGGNDSVGFFKDGAADDGGPRQGQNGERSGVSAEVVKGM